MQAKFNSKRMKLIKALGEIIRAHRLKLNKSIYLISAESSMSKSTWREAELGVCKDINLTTIWKISEGLEIQAGDLLIELSKKLGKDFTLAEEE